MNGAFAQLKAEMVGRHKAQRESLVIVRTTELKGELEHEAKRRQIRLVSNHDIKFPLLHKKLDQHQLLEKYLDHLGLFFSHK